ncbi:MAG: toxic anion resistance protein [Selenomonas ruminantium]|nr:toxic anion resistance protein [Selenomonas ruminantium]
MADINLDDLLKAKRAQEGSEAAAATGKEMVTVEQVSAAVETLTPEEKAQIVKIKDELDLTDSTAVLSYGAPAQKRIAEFSNNVLSQVRTKDSGQVGELLQGLVAQVKGYNPEGGSSGGSFLKKIPIVGSLVEKAEDVKEGYTKLSVQVDRIQGGLEQAKLKMMKDIALFDNLYEQNLAYFKNLQLYIQAGEEKLREMQEVTLPKLRAQAQESGDPMAVQVVADFEGSVQRFEKKVHDLKISKTIAIQTAPQIRLIQNNDKALVDRVQTAIYNTIPLWKNQMVIALGLKAQQDTLRLQQAVTNTTNDLLKRNAELLKQNTLEVAKENERSIVDIETVREVNEKLISTIEETVRIQQEGRQKRAAAEQELVQIEGRLRDTLMKNSGRAE